MAQTTRKKDTEEMAEKVADRVANSWRATQDTLHDAKEKTEEFVKVNPWKSMMVAAAVGVGVAYGLTILASRRRTFWDRLWDVF